MKCRVRTHIALSHGREVFIHTMSDHEAAQTTESDKEDVKTVVQPSVAAAAVSAEEQPPQQSDPFLDCDICLLQLKERDMKAHLAGSRHETSRRLYDEATEEDRAEVYTCELCEVQVRRIFQGPHNITRKHKERIQATKSEKHRKAMCLPDLDRAVAERIDEAVRSVHGRMVLTTEDERKRESIRSDIEKLLKKNLKVRLSIFGSTMSKFGSKKSDMDLSLSYTDVNLDAMSEDDQRSHIGNSLKKVKKLLYKMGTRVAGINLILSARVPVLKFIWTKLDLECDVCVGNNIAVENTRLLRTYAEIDPRVAQLGFILKAWARMNELNDAGSGSLSSYAYIVMMIHYLQRCSPPVLPCIQNMCGKDGTIPDNTIDGLSCGFVKDLSVIAKNWKTHNTQGVTELFDGLLRSVFAQLPSS